MLARYANGFKPYLPLSINWGHPLAQGLICCVIANNHGPGLVDLVSNTPLALQGAAVKAPFNFGWGLDCSQGANAGATVAIPSPMLKWNSSVGIGALAWGGAFSNTTPAQFTGIFGVTNGGGSEIALLTGNTPSTQITYINGANFTSAASLVGINPTYRDVVISFGSSSNPGGFTTAMIENGIVLNEGSPTNNLAVTSAFTLMVGDDPNRIGNSQTFFSYGYMWQRPLTLAEANWLHVDPYAFLNKSAKLWISDTGGGGGSLIKERRTLEQFGTRAGSRQLQWR